jgi:hypothetical protein
MRQHIACERYRLSADCLKGDEFVDVVCARKLRSARQFGAAANRVKTNQQQWVA